MANEQKKNDRDSDKPEEQKNIFERIGDFLNTPLPGTGPRDKDEDKPEQAARPAPTPPATKPANPPANAAPPAAKPVTQPPSGQGAVKTGAQQTSGQGTAKPGAAPAIGAGAKRIEPEAKPAPQKQAAPPAAPGATHAQPEAKPAASSAVTPPPPAVSHPQGLAVGGTAYVRREGGMPLRLRSAPDIAPDNIIDRLAIGTQLTLVGGPQSADGYEWWQVRTPDGRTGWVAGSELVTQL